MYYSQEKDNITREFTDLEAYYAGLIDYHEDVEKRGLGQSDFFLGAIMPAEHRRLCVWIESRTRA